MGELPLSDLRSGDMPLAWVPEGGEGGRSCSGTFGEAIGELSRLVGSEP